MQKSVARLRRQATRATIQNTNTTKRDIFYTYGSVIQLLEPS